MAYVQNTPKDFTFSLGDWWCHCQVWCLAILIQVSPPPPCIAWGCHCFFSSCSCCCAASPPPQVTGEPLRCHPWNSFTTAWCLMKRRSKYFPFRSCWLDIRQRRASWCEGLCYWVRDEHGSYYSGGVVSGLLCRHLQKSVSFSTWGGGGQVAISSSGTKFSELFIIYLRDTVWLSPHSVTQVLQPQLIGRAGKSSHRRRRLVSAWDNVQPLPRPHCHTAWTRALGHEQVMERQWWVSLEISSWGSCTLFYINTHTFTNLHTSNLLFFFIYSYIDSYHFPLSNWLATFPLSPFMDF